MEKKVYWKGGDKKMLRGKVLKIVLNQNWLALIIIVIHLSYMW
jgi:hypothetical protein